MTVLARLLDGQTPLVRPDLEVTSAIHAGEYPDSARGCAVRAMLAEVVSGLEAVEELLQVLRRIGPVEKGPVVSCVGLRLLGGLGAVPLVGRTQGGGGERGRRQRHPVASESHRSDHALTSTMRRGS